MWVVELRPAPWTWDQTVRFLSFRPIATLKSLPGPAPLKGPLDSSGFPVGCRSACEVNLDGNPSLCTISTTLLSSDDRFQL